jgi:hypothetical protein
LRQKVIGDPSGSLSHRILLQLREGKAMKNGNRFGVRNFLLCAITAALGSAGAATAADPSDFTTSFPAGVACDFELGLEGGGANFHTREFFNKNGDRIRLLTAGRGYGLTFTNVVTGATFSTRSNGSVQHEAFNADGSSTIVSTGHSILILFPTDVPTGPSSTLYVGRVVFTNDGNSNYVLLDNNGTATDICAALE